MSEVWMAVALGIVACWLYMIATAIRGIYTLAAHLLSRLRR